MSHRSCALQQSGGVITNKSSTCSRPALLVDPNLQASRTKFRVGKQESTGRSSRIMQLSKSDWLPFTRERDATWSTEAQTKRRAEEFSRTPASVNVVGDLCTLFFAFFSEKFSDPGPKVHPILGLCDSCEREKKLGPRPSAQKQPW